MSRHAGHETNSARPRVSSPSRRRRASPGTTSDAVANRTIKAKTPRRDVNTISGGEAPRGVMTEGRGRTRWVPFRRASSSSTRKKIRISAPGCLRFQTRVARWTRRRAGRRTSPRRRPASGPTARSARVSETSACPSSSRRTSWSRRRCALAPPTDFSPPTPPLDLEQRRLTPLPPPPAAPGRTSSRPSTSRACAKPSTARAPPTSPRTTATNPGPGSTTPSPPSCR